jgi:hypothetical protein
MQACTIGFPTVIRQFSIAASLLSASAAPVDPRRSPAASSLPVLCKTKEFEERSALAEVPVRIRKILDEYEFVQRCDLTDIASDRTSRLVG